MKQYIIILFCTFFGSMASLQAANGPWLESEYAKVRLISSTQATGNLEQIPAALEFQLKPDWKVYWRSPGDAGLPPILEAYESKHEIKRYWPVPERFTLFDIETFGYSDSVILPLTIKHIDKTDDFLFKGFLDALICSDICLPLSGDISLSLPKGISSHSIYAQEIAYAKAKVPSKTTGPNIEIISTSLIPHDRSLLIDISISSKNLEDIFVETNLAGYSFSKPIILKKLNDRILAQINIKGFQDPKKLMGQEVTLTILAGMQFKEEKLLIRDTKHKKNKLLPLHLNGFITILLISFLGGIILNFMPCVLPILSLKVANFLGTTGKPYSEVRKHFLSTAFGILFSFTLLSSGLIILRNIGYQIGWGIQFQNPIFLSIISVILLIFIATLLDWFYLPIPRIAVKLSSVISNNAGYRYDFFSGVLATILATPCSAPFVGTAVAFALSGSNFVLYSVLLIMGLGLSLPWLIFAIAPPLSSFLPKPGYWMVRIKQISAILLIGTLIWILWVLSNLLGMRAEVQNAELSRYKTWSVEVMEDAITTGRPVFVDVTADWCITCKVNKISVLESREISDAFSKENFILLQADWTSPNDEIAKFLASNGRFGIPFDIIFSPQLETPIILPEILTTEKLLSSIKKASLSQTK